MLSLANIPLFLFMTIKLSPFFVKNDVSRLFNKLYALVFNVFQCFYVTSHIKSSVRLNENYV